MPATVSKLRLSLLLLFLQLFVYLYVVPRDAGEPPDEREYPVEADCKASYPPAPSCLAGRGYFKELADNCGRKPPPPEPEPEQPEEQPEVAPEPLAAPDPPPTNLSQQPPAAADVRKERPEEAKPGHLIYQIIVVLLFLSVSFALADCFQERAKKKGLPEECERHDGLSRRMSLADLTMSRHARKESQASYRPLGEKRPLLATRSCSHEVPMKTKAVIRQTSCPQFDDDASTERRRVRMIQRH